MPRITITFRLDTGIIEGLNNYAKKIHRTRNAIVEHHLSELVHTVESRQFSNNKNLVHYDERTQWQNFK